MKDRILRNWTFMRLLRLGFALMFLAAAVTRHEPIAWFAAVFFGAQALFNFGCCGAGACQTDNTARTAPDLSTTVTYEEIK